MNKRERETYREEYRKHFDKARVDYLRKKAKDKALRDAERLTLSERLLSLLGSIISRFDSKKERGSQKKVRF